MAIRVNRTELLNIIAAVIFITGAVFMLVNVFGVDIWAFWTGFGLALVATTILITSYFDNRYNKDKHGKENQNPETPKTGESETPQSTKNPKS